MSNTLDQALKRLGQDDEDYEDEDLGYREEGGEMSHDEHGNLRWGRRAAGLLIYNESNQVFLVFRSPEVFDPNMWGIPGGRVEPSETEWDAAVSESSEELGRLPPVQRVDQKVYRSGDFTYTTFIVRMSDADAKRWRVVLNWENTKWGWFDPKRPPEPLHPGVRAIL